MKRLLEEKAESFGALGRAAVDLARAESDSLSGELKDSGRTLGRSTVFILLALFCFFWALGALAFLAVELLAFSFPRWGAVLLVFTVLLVSALLLATIGWLRIKRLEKPAAMVKRHWSEYRDWWSGRWIGERHRRSDTRSSDEAP
ncbi:MAG: phage holin family protein [Acidobacteriota bacterium]|nr:phage holin family protein [Acidobacteriota bacterium]